MQIRTSETLKISGILDFASIQSIIGKSGIWLRSFMVQEDLVEHPINLLDGRIWNDIDSTLPSTAATDDLGLIGGTWGTNCILLQTIDQDSNGTPTASYGLWRAQVPKEWVVGETMKLRIIGGMVTTVADTTATVDAEIYHPDGQDGVGSDICATAAQTINSALLSVAATTCDFTITTTTLSPGDVLEIRVAITIEDGATGAAVIGAINHLSILADTKG